MPKEIFPDKEEGDILGAGHVNKLNRVGRAFTSLFGGSYGYAKGGQRTDIAPFIQYPVEVVSLTCPDEPVPTDFVEVRPLYYDFDQAEPTPKWKLNDEAGPFCLDPTVYDDTSVTPPVSVLALEIGDRLAAFWDPQRNMFLPINPGVPGCDTIHFKIISANCIEKTAIVEIELRSKGCSTVPEEDGLGRVTVNDSMGCHLDEPNADLIDRKGAATYLTKESTGIDQWEIDDLCCDPNICLP